jgi:hypothetical protein
MLGDRENVMSVLAELECGKFKAFCRIMLSIALEFLELPSFSKL